MYNVFDFTMCDGIKRYQLTFTDENGKVKNVACSTSKKWIDELYCKLVGGVKQINTAALSSL